MLSLFLNVVWSLKINVATGKINVATGLKMERKDNELSGILLFIFFMKHRGVKFKASYLAQKFGLSTRTIYRKVDILTSIGIPINSVRGRDSGIYLENSYKFT